MYNSFNMTQILQSAVGRPFSVIWVTVAIGVLESWKWWTWKREHPQKVHKLKRHNGFSACGIQTGPFAAL